jgi:hypothetical protein
LWARIVQSDAMMSGVAPSVDHQTMITLQIALSRYGPFA